MQTFWNWIMSLTSLSWLALGHGTSLGHASFIQYTMYFMLTQHLIFIPSEMCKRWLKCSWQCLETLAFQANTHFQGSFVCLGHMNISADFWRWGTDVPQSRLLAVVQLECVAASRKRSVAAKWILVSIGCFSSRRRTKYTFSSNSFFLGFFTRTASALASLVEQFAKRTHKNAAY